MLSEFFRATRLKRIGATFIATFGFVWLFLEPAGLFLPNLLDWGWWGYGGLVLVSLIYGIMTNFPARSMSRPLSSPDSIVEIKVGNLFEQPEHLVIGLNDVFDTELGEIIKSTSVQGQFLDQVYKGDRGRLDEDIDKALALIGASGRTDPGKTRGKTERYPIGTTPVLGAEGRRYFLSAYGRMGNDLRVKSTVDDIWVSLGCLWEQVRLRGHGCGVSIPIIGSELARTNLPRMTLTKLIIMSFIVASKREYIAPRLTVVIYPSDIDKVDLPALEEFLESVCF